jgi:hypothetical protein
MREVWHNSESDIWRFTAVSASAKAENFSS